MTMKVVAIVGNYMQGVTVIASCDLLFQNKTFKFKNATFPVYVKRSKLCR